MAACHFVGLSVWVSAKVWGAIFGIATLPYVFGVVHRAGVSTKLAMLASIAACCVSQFCHLVRCRT